MTQEELIDDSVCKNCGTHNHCPCSACKANKFTKESDIKWDWKNQGNTAHCGKCGKLLFS